MKNASGPDANGVRSVCAFPESRILGKVQRIDGTQVPEGDQYAVIQKQAKAFWQRASEKHSAAQRRGAPGRTGAGDGRGVCRRDLDRYPAADAALCHPQRGKRRCGHRAVHRHFGHLCHRADCGRYLSVLESLWSGGHPLPDPDRRAGIYDHCHRPVPTAAAEDLFAGAAAGGHLAEYGRAFRYGASGEAGALRHIAV